ENVMFHHRVVVSELLQQRLEPRLVFTHLCTPPSDQKDGTPAWPSVSRQPPDSAPAGGRSPVPPIDTLEGPDRATVHNESLPQRRLWPRSSRGRATPAVVRLMTCGSGCPSVPVLCRPGPSPGSCWLRHCHPWSARSPAAPPPAPCHRSPGRSAAPSGR